MNKSIDRVFSELRCWHSASKVTQMQISKATGVNQSQVSKILSGRFRRVSRNVALICEYANIQIKLEGDRVLSERLNEAVLELWDGTASSEKDLLQILKALKLIGRVKRCADSVVR